MGERKQQVATEIADHCDFGYAPSGKQHTPFNFHQIRMILDELEDEEPNPATDKADLMCRIADECDFPPERYDSSSNGPPPFLKTHLVDIRDELEQRD